MVDTAIEAREWPADVDEERSMLGVGIIDPAQLPQVANLSPELFSLDSHRRIQRAMYDLVKSGCTATDYIELCKALRRRGDLEAVGGATYVQTLGEGVVAARSFDRRVEALQEFSFRRRLIAMGGTLQQKAADERNDIAEVFGWVAKELAEASCNG